METLEIPRSLEGWQYFNSINHMGYFTIICLISKEGKLSISRSKLSSLMGITVSQVRKIESDLELGGFISLKNTLNSSSIITINHIVSNKKVTREPHADVVENKVKTCVSKNKSNTRITRESHANHTPKTSELAQVVAPAEYIPPQGEATPEKVVAMWNRIAEQTRLPEVLFLNQDRKKRVSIAIDALKDCDCWRGVFDEMQEDDFLMGRVDGKNFKASFDWLLQCKRGTQTKNYILLYEKFVLRTKKGLDDGK